jgi:hypothetical protein
MRLSEDSLPHWGSTCISCLLVAQIKVNGDAVPILDVLVVYQSLVRSVDDQKVIESGSSP